MPFTPRNEGYVPPHLPTIKREVNKLMDGVKRVGAKQTNVFVSATSGYLIGNITRGAWVGRLTPVERCPQWMWFPLSGLLAASKRPCG